MTFEEYGRERIPGNPRIIPRSTYEHTRDGYAAYLERERIKQGVKISKQYPSLEEAAVAQILAGHPDHPVVRLWKEKQGLGGQPSP